MKKIMIAVDSLRESKGILSLFKNLLWKPDRVVLVHVEQLEGNAVMTAMLSDSEISTLKESLEGTEHKASLDRNAEKVLTYYRKELENEGLVNIKCLTRSGHPSEEILRAAEEEAVDLIIVGCSGKTRLQRLVTGCVSRDIEKLANVPVLISKGDGCGDHAHMWEGREAYAVR